MILIMMLVIIVLSLSGVVLLKEQVCIHVSDVRAATMCVYLDQHLHQEYTEFCGRCYLCHI